MKKYLVLLLLSSLSLSAMAQNACEKLQATAKEECYTALADELEDKIDEHYARLIASSKVSLEEKVQANQDHKDFMNKVAKDCPDAECKSMAYTERLKTLKQAAPKAERKQ